MENSYFYLFSLIFKNLLHTVNDPISRISFFRYSPATYFAQLFPSQEKQTKFDPAQLKAQENTTAHTEPREVISSLPSLFISKKSPQDSTQRNTQLGIEYKG